MDITISLNGIRKRYGEKTLFSDFQAEFDRFACCFITGSNGSGKSTLLRIAGQLLEPDAGKVVVTASGKALKKDAYRAMIGMVSPDLQLYDALTATENIAFLAGLRVPGLKRTAIEHALRSVGLTAVANQRVGTFSTGMKQRLKFALLLCADASVWLLDEPTSNLDDAGKAMVARVAREAVKRGKVVLWATNEEQEVWHAAVVYHLGNCRENTLERADG